MVRAQTLALTCIRDEGPWLLDWIAHHQALGFDHFLVASHDCEDGTDRLLEALAEAKIVTHLPFTPSGKKSYQWQAMQLLSAHDLYQNADIALFFDVDEYLCLERLTDLRALLPEDADAMPLRWRLFGHDGQSTWEDRPVTERFTRAAPKDINLPLAHFFKTLHRPAAFRELGVHRPKGKNADWVTAALSPLPPSFAQTQARIQLFGQPSAGEVAWLNHYSVRSIEEFVLKSARGLPNHVNKRIGTGYWAERNFNTAKDTTIARFAQATAAKRLALAAFDAQHQSCVAHHQTKLHHLKTQKPVIEMMWQLELMAGSTPPTPAQLSAHLERLKGVNS